MVKTKIAFFLSSITDGGQSKVSLDIASGLAERGYDVRFFFSSVSNDIFLDSVHEKLELVDIGIKPSLKSNLPLSLKTIIPLAKSLKRFNPDIVISGGNVNNCVAIIAKSIFRQKIKIITTEHADLTSCLNNTNPFYAKIVLRLMKLCYPRANIVAAVSQGVADDLAHNLDLNTKSIEVIYNPIVNDQLIMLSELEVQHPFLNQKNVPLIISVGRLSVQKNYENLIDAFHLFLKHSNANLLIIGEGPERLKLQNKIDELDLGDKVDLFGHTSNPYKYISRADLFVLSSLWEGLPTVLIEALACNTPIVSTDCPHGPREILESGKWGSLVPIENSKALSDAMLDMIDNPITGLTNRANDFTSEKSIEKYINTINATL